MKNNRNQSIETALHYPHLLLTIQMLTSFFGATIAEQESSLLTRHEVQFAAMGVNIKIIAYAETGKNFATALEDAKSELLRLNSVFSNYISDSEIVRLAEHAPKLIPVSDSLWEVAMSTDEVFRNSKGAFDPTVGVLTPIWRMARKRNRLPRNGQIADAVEHVGWSRQIVVDKKTKAMACANTSVALDFGGIAKGFAADRIVQLFNHRGITSVLVEFGGDIAVGDAPPDSQGWLITIDDRTATKCILSLRNCGVATSGDSKQYLFEKGIRYSHIVDPRTGYALKNAHSVTVVAENCALADAYASALNVMTVDEGLKMLEKLPRVEARIVSKRGNGKQQPISSRQFDSHRWPGSLADPAPGLSD